MALRCIRLAIHNGGKIPLVTRPRHRSAHLDVRIRAVHPYLLHARSLLLVDSEIVAPAKDGGRPGAIHDRDVIRIILVQLLDVPNLPGAQHVRKHVINLLLIGQGNHHIGSIRRGRSVLLLFLFLLCCGWRRTSQKERGGKEKWNCSLEDAGAGTNYKIFVHSRATPLAEENSTAIRTRRRCAQLVYLVREAPSRLTNRRYAPGTPSGNWRKKASPV